MKRIIWIFILFTSLASCGQTNKESELFGREQAEEELKTALNNMKLHNVIDNKTIIIQDSSTAIKVAELILSNIYGIDNIQKQKPYKSYLIKNYWVISGTLSEDYAGGVFLIIIDATNSEVIRITHGK